MTGRGDELTAAIREALRRHVRLMPTLDHEQMQREAYAALAELSALVEQQEARLQRAVELLGAYGKHRHGCGTGTRGGMFAPGPCTCGLEQSLADLAAAVPASVAGPSPGLEARVAKNAPGAVCDACGLDLTPTPEQMAALHRFGNPLRRPPCLETESGHHVVGDRQFFARVSRPGAAALSEPEEIGNPSAGRGEPASTAPADHDAPSGSLSVAQPSVPDDVRADAAMSRPWQGPSGRWYDLALCPCAVCRQELEDEGALPEAGLVRQLQDERDEARVEI